MGTAIKEKLIGARIPVTLKEILDEYCKKHGIKMNFFVIHAIKEKLLEAIEDEDDIEVINERLKDSEFMTAQEFHEHLAKRGIKI